MIPARRESLSRSAAAPVEVVWTPATACPGRRGGDTMHTRTNLHVPGPAERFARSPAPVRCIRSLMLETRLTLLDRVARGADDTSWAEFVGLYEPLLLAFARKKGLAAHDAEDVVQTIFVSLLRNLARYDRARGKFRTWLRGVADNAVVDLWRKKQTAANAEKGWRELPPKNDDDEAEWDRAHRRRILEHATAEVKGETAPKTWACFEGHVLLDRPGADVGAELGLPANSVYVNAARVLERIRKRCAKWNDELGEDPS